MTSGLAERVRHPRFERLLVGALFLISGLAALVYQVAWQRLLAFHSGVGVTSVALIVGAFMAGLGLGSHVGGALSARVSRGAALRAFGLIEIGIGLFAVISCWLFYDVLLHRASGLYATVWGSAAGHVLALGIPTTLMGMSLPFLVRAMVRDGATAPGTIAILYGINVVGAAVGALVTPWVLIRHLGIPGAVLAGAGGSLVTGLVTLGLSFHPSWRSGESAEAPASRPVEPARAGAQGLGLWAALYGLSGFVALSLEIVWFRIADVAIKSAAFTFGSILFVYLGGLALGSLGGARRAAAREDPGVGPLGHPYRTFLLAIAGLLAYSGAIVWLLVELPSSSLGWFFTYWARYDGFGGLILREPGAFLRLYVLLPAVLYGPPTVLMGLAFAALHRAVQDDPRTSGRKVGLLQAANIGGCVAGSLLVGLVGLTHLGSAGTLRALLALGLVFCIAGLRAERGRARAPFAALAALLLLLTAGFPSTQRLWERLHGLEPGAANLVDEDATGVVVLAPEGAARWRLSTNGHGISWLPFGGVHTWLGALPALVHPAPRDVAIIGLGSGDTAWGSGVRPETSHVTVFEICAPQARLLRRLADGNPEDSSGLSALRSFLADRRMSFELADGRHALLREDRTYDVIELDALRPQAAYSGNLYSLEFYRLCAKRLSPGGLMCTWAPTWRVHQTFRRVFPHVLELDGGQILVGSLEPIPMDSAAWDARAVLAQPYLGAAQTEALRQRLASARLCPEPVASEANLNRDLHPRDELVSPTGRSTVFAPGPGGGTALHVPAVAHAAGAGGSLWRTDLDVRNPGPQTAEFELLLLKRDWDNTEPARRSYTAAAGQTVRLSDVLASAFGETGAAALRLVSGAKGLEVTSRTYNTASPEALGVSIPALGGPAMTTGGAARLDHLRQTAGGSRTNLGFVSGSPAFTFVEARFQRADGTALGTRRFGLKPFEFRQADRVLEGLGEGLDNVSAVLSSEDPEARFLTFATVIDGTSGAARFVAPRQVARPDRAEPEAR